MNSSSGLTAAFLSEEIAAFLVTPEGGRVIAEIAALPGDAAERMLTLRKRGVDRDLAAGALEIAAARRRARARFADSEKLFFTSDSLAQATSPMIARYHAARLAPLGVIADLGCGVGMDAIALAEAGAAGVVAIERDPARLIFARANADIRGVRERIDFRLGDVTQLDWSADAVYWDPSRRESDGHRVSNYGERYEPPLSFLDAVKGKVSRGGCVKLSPGLPDDVLADLGGSVVFLSEARECKEACLWFGEAQSPYEPTHSALLLPENLIVTGETDNESLAPVGPLAEYVFDPDPAIIRANALGSLGEILSADLVSGADSYMTGSTPRVYRGASCYRVIHALPFKVRDLGDWLRKQEIGRLVVKKRHFPKEPDALARELKLKGGGREATLILVRLDEGGHLAIICEPVKSDANL